MRWVRTEWTVSEWFPKAIDLVKKFSLDKPTYIYGPLMKK